MEPIPGSTSGHTQLLQMKEVVHVLMVQYPLVLYIGSDYYCESGTGSWSWVLYPNDPLWDGQDCNGLEHTCCDSPNLPWFCKELPEPTNDNLELRICGDQVLFDEDTPVDLVQLYIQ